MRIVLKSFLSGGPHEGSPGDVRDVEPDQAEHLIAVGAATLAPEQPPEPEPAAVEPPEPEPTVAGTKSTPTKSRKAEEIV